MILLLAGLILSLIGSLPPGFISLLVAHTSISKGPKAALWAASGASIVETVQAWLATVIATWLLANPKVEQGFQWAALAVFLSVGTYLIFRAPDLKMKKEHYMPQSPWRQLGRGALISLFNMMALPYWFAYCGWLNVNGWWPDSPFSVVFFSLGVGLGTFSALAMYTWAAQLAIDRAAQIGQYMNRFIGIVFYVLACEILVNLF